MTSVPTTSRAQRAKRLLPFGAVAALAFLVLPSELRSPNELAIAVAAALSCGIAATEWLVPWHRLPRWSRGLPAFSFLVVVGLLRAAEGGGISIYGPLALLPIVWFALYGSRAELILSVFVASVMAGMPDSVISAGTATDREWRREIMAIAVGGLIGLIVQQLVRQLKERSEAAEGRAAELAAAKQRINEQATNLATVVEATREFAAVQSPEAVRQRICEAAVVVARADMAIFFEPQPNGAALRISASTDPTMVGLAASLTDEASGAAASFTSAQRLFAPLAAAHPMLSQRLVQATGAQSVLFQPVIRDGSTVAVLGLGWRNLHPYLSDRRMALVELLANEAAHAIEHARFVSRLAELARTDELTGLPNRREWDETLTRELARAHRGDQPLTVAMIDLDEFKDYNDRNGHQAGDRLLKQAAAAWQGELRATDVLARYGGEEFVLALPDCPIDAAVELAERLRAVMPEGETCSVGLAQWNGLESEESLVRRADAALYKAKRAGRDCAVVSNWLPAIRSA